MLRPGDPRWQGYLGYLGYGVIFIVGLALTGGLDVIWIVAILLGVAWGMLEVWHGVPFLPFFRAPPDE
jgi:hypothetical protein